MSNRQFSRDKILAITARITLLITVILLATVIIKKVKYRDNAKSTDTTSNSDTALADSYSAPLNKYFFQVDTTDQQIGKTESIIEYQTNTCYGIHYPVLGDKTIDNILKTDVDITLSQFLEEFKDYVAVDENSRAYLSIEYNSYLVGDSIASVIYKIQYDSPTYTNPINKIHTHVFLLSTSEEITPERIFTGDYLDFFSKKTSDFLSSDSAYVDSLTSEKYKNNFTPAAENFKKFILTNEGLTLYFEPYKIASGELETISFTIPASELIPYMIFNPFEKVTVPQPSLPNFTVSPGSLTIDPSKPMIALTFDDGPDSKSTNRILDVLEANNAHATFFVVGSRLGSEPDTLIREYSLGCEIGSHSYSHKAFSTLKKKNIHKELANTNKLLKKIIGVKASLVRTPYGEKKKSILKNVKYPVILWDIDTEDWKTKNKKKIVKKVIGKVKDGDIIIMHDIYASTASAVEAIVPKLISEGYQLVTVSELLKSKGIKIKPGKAYYNGIGN